MTTERVFKITYSTSSDVAPVEYRTMKTIIEAAKYAKDTTKALKEALGLQDVDVLGIEEVEYSEAEKQQ